VSETESSEAIGFGSRRRLLHQAFFIAALALTLNLAGNGRISLWDRDEPRYAGCAREMIAKGEWIFPTFNDEPRFHKPILIYWLMRAGFAIGGDNPFGARLISALAGTATSLLVLVMGRRMLGPRAGFLGALMLTTAPIMVIESKLATTDATLALFLVAGQFCLWELSKRPSKSLASLFWIVMGLATLTKGPVGLALIASAGAVSWWFGGPKDAWSRLHWRWGIPLFFLVIAPWFIAIGIASGGDFFRFAVGRQLASRVVSKLEDHGGFPGYYIVTGILTFHPWSALLPPAIYCAWRRRRDDPRLGFLLGWIVGPLILLECVRTKLVHYYLPAIPACAMLVGWLVDRVVSENSALSRFTLGRSSVNLLGGTGIGMAVSLCAGLFFLPRVLWLPCLGMTTVIAIGTVLGVRLLYQASTERAIGVLSTTWALALLFLSFWFLPAAEPFRLSRIVGEKLAKLSDREAAPPLLLNYQEPSLIHELRRHATLVRTWKGLYEELEQKGQFTTAMIYPRETEEFARRAEHLEIDVQEVVKGFDLNKGQTQTLHLAVIRRKRGVPLPPPELAGEPYGKKLLVK